MAFNIVAPQLLPNDFLKSVHCSFGVHELLAQPFKGILLGEMLRSAFFQLLFVPPEEGADLHFIGIKERHRQRSTEKDPDEALTVFEVVELLVAIDGVQALLLLLAELVCLGHLLLNLHITTTNRFTWLTDA